MKIRKALMLATEGKKVRCSSWYPGEYVYCKIDRYYLVQVGTLIPTSFIVHPAHVLAEDWEVYDE